MSETNTNETPAAASTAKGTAEDPIVLKQMNQKALGIDPKSVRKMVAGSSIKLGIFFGVIQGLKMKESKFSDELNAQFIGEFRAVHPVTGAIYTAEKAYFFKALSDKLSATFGTNGQRPVEFAYEISSQEAEKAQLGYEYVAQSLIPTAASDRMTAIAEAVQAKLTQRALPAATPAPPAPAASTPAPPAPAASTQTSEETEKAKAKTKAR